MGVKVVLQDIKKLETEALIAVFFEDGRPLTGLAGELDWLLCGLLSSLILQGSVRGALGEAALLTSRGKVPAGKIFLLGMGSQAEMSPASLRTASGRIAECLVRAGVKEAAIEYFVPGNTSYEAAVSSIQEGLATGSRNGSLEITLLAPHAVAYEKMSRILQKHRFDSPGENA